MTKLARLLALGVLVLAFPSLVFAAKTHKVKKNETLNSLAKKYHVTSEELKTANNLVQNHIKPGTLLVIPPRSVAAERSTSRKTSSYKVKKGDSLLKIAKKTGVSVDELKRINHLTGQRLKTGVVLALQEAESNEAPVRPVAKRYSARIAEVFNDRDYEQSLAELADTSPEQPVDLNRSVELKADTVKQLKKTAYGFLGARYRFGGSSRNALDCSSFVQQVFREMEVPLPRTAREQFGVGMEVPHGDLKRGDLVFFRTYASFPSHVGIYLGDNKMIHASSRDRRVVISTMNTSYYRARYIGAKRISKINPDTFQFDDLIAGIEEEMPDEAMSNDTLGLSSIN
jgi:cell wall-associated NlpC family hydrolase